MQETCFYYHDSTFSKDINKPGIYGIFSIASNKWYIGQAVKVGIRLRNHKAMLRDGTHENEHLNFAASKYGIENFIFVPLEFCKRSELNDLEVYYIKFYNSIDPDYGYNKTLNGNVTEYSEECKNNRRVAYDTRKTSKKHLAPLIRSMYPEKSIVEIGKEVGIHPSTVNRIIYNKVYIDDSYTPPKISHLKYNELKAKETILKHINSGMSREDIRRNFGISSREMIKHTRGIGVIQETSLLLNIETGIYYNNMNEAAASTGYLDRSTLRYWLIDEPRLNKSPFILIDKKPVIKKEEIILLDESTGIYYESFVDAASIYSMSPSTLHVWLEKKPYRNKTSLKLV